MRVNRQTRRDARKLVRLCLDEGDLNAARVRDVGRRVSESSHRGRFAILWEFQRLVKLESARRTAEIASAVPLQPELRERIIGNLGRLYAKRLQIHFVEKPELIGGVRVSVGSDVYDDSIRYRLSLLERSFSATNGW